jgi:26S proteasome regulatory subunit N7
MAEDNVLPIPNLTLPQQYYTLLQPSLSNLHAAARTALLDGIKADSMAPYYRVVASTGALKMDDELLKKMEKENEEELEKFDKRLKDAEETEGESEIGDALKAKAIYLTKIGERASYIPVHLVEYLVIGILTTS